MYTSGIGFCFIRDLVSNLKVLKSTRKGVFCKTKPPLSRRYQLYAELANCLLLLQQKVVQDAVEVSVVNITSITSRFDPAGTEGKVVCDLQHLFLHLFGINPVFFQDLSDLVYGFLISCLTDHTLTGWVKEVRHLAKHLANKFTFFGCHEILFVCGLRTLLLHYTSIKYTCQVLFIYKTMEMQMLENPSRAQSFWRLRKVDGPRLEEFFSRKISVLQKGCAWLG